ncbi:MAG TPA: tRNA (adenosine(37)-N6)-dimethylallyltransferase MiaA [Candidatus Saccharimonadales bacterium]|nr:tRNA (adenosine(37)-N6)-dimethylallyltransferase MiaA [Candidatus Saccharimonadales bacterium]
MGSAPNTPPLIAIVGQTASGKTALAIQLAKKFNGEVIAADSRTIYKELSIGTAKPTMAEQDGIRHHLLDVITPDKAFSAADFKRQAVAAITEISQAGKLPIMVGGTGLYIDAILYDFTFGALPDQDRRKALQELNVEELQAMIKAKRLVLPENSKNPRHLIRVIETGGVVSQPKKLRANTLVIGLSVGQERLKSKLAQRVNAMVSAGLIDEIKIVSEKYGWDAPGLQATGYRAFRQYIGGEILMAEAKEKFVQNDMQLAKRQRTWFKRNKSIHWVGKQDEAVDLVTTFLNK